MSLLNKDAKLLLLVSTLFTIAVALSNTFVNVYLWKIVKNYFVIGWFNFFHFTGMMITFILAGKMAKTMDRIFLLRLGVGMLSVFFLVVLLLGEKAANHYILVGLLIGIGQGFYWFSFNLLYFEITDPDNRDIFNGMNGLFTSVGGMIAPFLSGWFLSHQKGVTGYKTIFFISLLVFLLAVIVSFFFYKRKSIGQYRLKQVIKQTLHQKAWSHVFLAMMAQGGREGVITFLIGLLVYIYTKNEFSLGTYSMVISGVSLVTYFLVGKWLKKTWRNHSMLIGSMMMSVAVIPMFLDTNYTTLLIYGIGTSIFAPLYFIPLTSVVFDLIGINEDSANLRDEYIVIREIGLNLGRMFSVLIFIFFIATVGEKSLRFLLLVTGSLPILTWFFMKTLAVKGYELEGE